MATKEDMAIMGKGIKKDIDLKASQTYNQLGKEINQLGKDINSDLVKLGEKISSFHIQILTFLLLGGAALAGYLYVFVEQKVGGTNKLETEVDAKENDATTDQKVDKVLSGKQG